MYGISVHAAFFKGGMQLAHFRHKGLRQLHEHGNAKGLPSSMADKLGKLLFALETANDLEQVSRFPGNVLFS